MASWNTTGNTTAAGAFLGTKNNQPLVVKTNATANPVERLRVETNGNVGIGTSTPGRALEVAAADANTGIKLTGTNSNRSWLMTVGAIAGDGKLNIFDFGSGASRLTIDTNGNVGIGTTTPNYALHLPSGKVLRIEASNAPNDNADYFSFGGNGSFGIDSPGVPDGRFVVQNSGNVGIGTPNPTSKLQVNGDTTISGNVAIGGGATPLSAVEIAGQGARISWYEGTMPTLTLTNTTPYPQPDVIYPPAASIDFNTYVPSFRRPEEYNPSSSIQARDAGNYGNDIVFLSNAPGDVCNGLVERMRITSTGNIDVPGDIILTGADCAEQFDVGDAGIPEPGTVVVIDEQGALRSSSDPYDKKVAGVVSGAGDFKHGILLDRRSDADSRVPVALLGKVYCKADAGSSPIEIGDMLTTSSTPGHAMKATDIHKAFGAVLGKALKPLARGTGLIPILVALQ